jgi:type IV pilus assembly protein PilM
MAKELLNSKGRIAEYIHYMALPFFNAKSKKHEQIVAIDLGGRSTKAVYLQRKGEVFTLLGYCVMDAPVFEKNISADLLGEHLKAVHQALEPKTKLIALALGSSDSLVRQTELPQIPLGDLRLMIKNNSKNYLQQDLQGYIFDCHYGAPVSALASKEAAPGKSAGPASQKLKVLVGGAKQQYLAVIQSAAREAGLTADKVLPGIIGPFNAFELSQPDAFLKESVALVDIGFKSTTVGVAHKGELAVTRVVNIGGDRLTQGLAEAMNISYAEAEGIKIGMPVEVEAHLEPLLTPLGRELRASIDFFEHQHDRTVSQIYVCGGSSRSEFIIKSLQNELMAPCKTWNPTAGLQLALPPAQTADLEQVSPQLAVALGAAAAVL